MKEFLLVERTGYLPNRYHWTLEDQTPGNQVVLAIDSQTDSHTGAQLWDEKHICGNVHERIKAKWTSVNGGERVYDFKSVMPRVGQVRYSMIILLRTLFLLRSTRNHRGHG